MDAQNIFNLILLTLSLSTILLTLVSYILYRAKQTGSNDPAKKQLKLEGVFFKRYLPKAHLQQLRDQENGVKQKTQREFFIVPKKIVPFFIVIALVIFLSFFLSNALKHRTESPVAAFHVRASQSEINSATLEKLSDSENRPFSHHPILREQKFYLFESAVKQSPEAARAWEDFLRENSLTQVQTLSEATVLLIPEAIRLKDAERETIEKQIKAGKSVIATGAIGILDGLGRPDPKSWAKKWFGVDFSRAPHPETFLPTILAGREAPFEMVPGLILNWSPTDNNYVARAREGASVLAFEGDYQGHPSLNVRAVSLSRNSSRSLWLNMDPKVKLEPHGLQFLVNAMGWVAHEKTAKVSNWPKDAPGALLLSVDSEDQFSNVSALLEVFKSVGAHATFMVVSNLYAKNASLLPIHDELIEIGSHSEDHSLFEGQSLDVQFSRIQQSLNEIEKYSEAAVQGFRAPEERSDNSTLLACEKSSLKWVLTKRLFDRRAPVWVGNGQLLVFPRLTVDDFWFLKNNVAPEQVVSTLQDEARLSYQVGGMDILNLHSHVFGKEAYLPVLKQALEKIASLKGWQPTLSDAYRWWNARSRTTLEFDSSHNLILTNLSNSELKDPVVYIDDGEASLKKVSLSTVPPGEKRSIPLK